MPEEVTEICGNHIITRFWAGRNGKSKSMRAAFIAVIAVGIMISLVLASAPPTRAASVPRGPISIIGDSSFTPANGVNGGGSGTQLDPYIIENWVISASGANGIQIQNTTKYFVIRNCLVENGSSSYYGIYLNNVISGKVENNTCKNNKWGIYLFSSSNNTLTNNTCEGNVDCGIYLEYSDSNNLTNNTCRNNHLFGILLCHSSYNNLTNNNCGNSYYGILLRDWSEYNILDKNTCENNAEGICIVRSSYNNLTNNTCGNNGDGINLFSSSNNTISRNTCENNWSGILLESSSYDNFLNNTFKNNSVGIYTMSNSSYCTISRNYLLNNTENNAHDDGTNYWDNKGEGNYWSDWQPPEHPDVDGDGIVDEPRPIEGGGNQDNYPLVLMGFSPTQPSTTPPQAQPDNTLLVAVGAVIAIAALLAALFYLRRARKRQAEKRPFLSRRGYVRAVSMDEMRIL